LKNYVDSLNAKCYDAPFSSSQVDAVNNPIPYTMTETEKKEHSQLITVRDAAKKAARIAQLKIEAIENAAKLRSLQGA
jgi:hypothetical protein